MSSVLEVADVSVVRGAKTLLDSVNWTVQDGERWVILGPNGAGKSTLLSIAAARLHPTTGMVDILDEILGAVDVFELRPRIGLSSAPLAGQIPHAETVANVVLTAAYCLGLGVPFILIALAMRRGMGAMSFFRRHRLTLQRVGGVVLVLIGLAMATGVWSALVSWIQSEFVTDWVMPI